SQTVATFTDPGGAESLADYSADINWGDGTPTQVGGGTITLSNGVFTVGGSHTYADNKGTGTWPITVTIRHDAAPQAVAVSAAAIANVAPTATLSSAGSVTYGQATTVSFSSPFDPSSADDAAGFHYAFAADDPYALDGASYTANSGVSNTTSFS